MKVYYLPPKSSREPEYSFYNILTPFEKAFLEGHNLRIQKFLNKIEPMLLPGDRILNVGLSVFDLLFMDKFKEKRLEYKVAVPNSNFGKVNQYDNIPLVEINLCDPKTPTSLEGYFDWIILSGVLEHLFCDDEMVFSYLNSFLRDMGKLIVVVPNAASFVNRFHLLMGKNIHWKKSEILGGTEFGGYGHIREYTRNELEIMGKKYFKLEKLTPVNDYMIRGINVSFLNRILPVTWAIDLEAYYVKT